MLFMKGNIFFTHSIVFSLPPQPILMDISNLVPILFASFVPAASQLANNLGTYFLL